MKIGIISDIHSNLFALETVLTDLKKHNVKMIFNAGDNVGYSPFPNECIDILKREKIISAKGNYDDAVAYNRPFCGCGEGDERTQSLRLSSLNWTKKFTSNVNKEYLAQIPKLPEIQVNHKVILTMHGSLDELNQFIYEDNTQCFEEMARCTNADVIIMGHTHKSFIKIVSGKLFVNPGSVGKPVDRNPDSSYAIVDLTNMHTAIYRVKYDVQKNIEALKLAGMEEAIIEDLKTGIPFSRTGTIV